MPKENRIKILIIACAALILFPIAVFAAGTETYTVSFNSMGGSPLGDVKTQPGAAVNRPQDPANPGYMLLGWYREEECINEWKFEADIVTGDIALFAAWKELYTISAYPADPSMGYVLGGGDYPGGAAVTLSAVPEDGYRFVQWAESGSTEPVCLLVASVNTELTAKFAPIDTPSLTAAPSGYNSVALSWTPLGYAAGYEIYRSAGEDGEYSLVYRAAGETLSFVDSGLDTGAAYYYGIRAFCACETAATYGSLSKPVSAMPEIETPSTAAFGGGYRSARVSWGKAPGASGYEICRSAAQDGTYSKVGTLEFSEASGYTDYNLTDGQTYFYKVRAYRTASGKTYYSDYSDIQAAGVSLSAPALNAVSASATGIRLTWNALPGVGGYELYRSASQDGRYKKIYTAASASTVIFTNSGLKKGTEYFYKIRAFGKQGSKKVYGEYSQPVSAVPSTVLAERTFTILYQSDPQWGFSEEVRKSACLMCAYAITLSNMGIEATPKTVYETNGNTTYITPENLGINFGVRPVCATDLCSPYLRSYTGFGTYINNPSVNGAAAIKEALNRHPEGVICYFRKGDEAHAIVACRYDGDTIYFSDPGRSRKKLLTFGNTWVRYGHRMTYGNLSYIVALEKINEP